MANSVHSVHEKRNHAYLYPHIKSTSHNACHVTCNDNFTPRTMIASSSDRSRTRCHAISHTPKNRKASQGPSIIFHSFDASYIIHYKNGKVIATNGGTKMQER
jgi:hypothetical protein